MSPAEVRKLLQRLPSLRDRPSQELIEVVRTIGGHPRMLEFLDALLAGGVGRLPHVTARLKAALAHAGLAAGATIGDVSEALQQTIVLGTRDVFLEELVAIAQANDTDAVLLQVAVSNLPVSASGVAHTLADAPPKSAATARVVSALEQLERLSLVVRLGDEGY